MPPTKRQAASRQSSSQRVVQPATPAPTSSSSAATNNHPTLASSPCVDDDANLQQMQCNATQQSAFPRFSLHACTSSSQLPTSDMPTRRQRQTSANRAYIYRIGLPEPYWPCLNRKLSSKEARKMRSSATDRKRQSTTSTTTETRKCELQVQELRQYRRSKRSQNFRLHALYVGRLLQAKTPDAQSQVALNFLQTRANSHSTGRLLGDVFSSAALELSSKLTAEALGGGGGGTDQVESAAALVKRIRRAAADATTAGSDERREALSATAERIELFLRESSSSRRNR